VSCTALLQVAAQLVRQGCALSTKELKKKKTSTVRPVRSFVYLWYTVTCQICFVDLSDLLTNKICNFISQTHWSTEQDEQLQDHMSLHHPITPVPLSEVDIDALMRLFPGK